MLSAGPYIRITGEIDAILVVVFDQALKAIS